MNTALYHTYRPRQFADLIGQQHIRQTLLNELQQASVSHAYILSGPRGIGKTSTARLLAQAINCTNRQAGEPCLQCSHCELILAGKAFDIIEIDAASHTGVDHVREQIIDHARVSPVSLLWKVFIIDEVHMLSTSAFNALLKILEEPPKNVLFILATTELHKVPATIISRCERLIFQRAQVADIVQCLEKIASAERVTVEAEVLQAVAIQADGSLRDAESILGQLFSLAEDSTVTMEVVQLLLPQRPLQAMHTLWNAIIGHDTAAALQVVRDLMNDGFVMQQFIQQFIEYTRAVLMARVHNTVEALEIVGVPASQQAELLQSLQGVPPQRIAEVIGALVPVYTQRSIPGAPQLPFEIALVTLTASATSSETPTATPAAPVVTPPTTSPTPVVQPPQPVTPSTQPAATVITPVAAPATPSVTAAVQPTPPAETPVASADTKSSAQLTLALVQQKWPSVLKGMKEKNHALNLTFQVGQLIEVRDSTIVLAFEHQFYYDRIHDHRNFRMIHDVLEEVFGGTVTCEVVVQPADTTAATPVTEQITAAVETAIAPEPTVAVQAPVNSETTTVIVEAEPESTTASIWDLANQAFGATSAQAYGKKSASS